MPHYRVLKELPQGQQPGDTIELTEDVGDVLLLVDAVQKVEAAEAADTADDPKSSSARRRYQRRDLEAEP